MEPQQQTKTLLLLAQSAKPGTWKALTAQERKDMRLTKSCMVRAGANSPILCFICQVPLTGQSCLIGCMWQMKDVFWQQARSFGKLCLAMTAPTRKAERACCGNTTRRNYEASSWPGDKRLPQLTLKDSWMRKLRNANISYLS